MLDTRLYILMRSDLLSMNPGKGMAQAAHAANAFIFDVHKKMSEENHHLWEQQEIFVKEWQKTTTQGFGTTITLDVESGKSLLGHIQEAQELNLLSNIVHDPTYPVRDGDVTHLIPVDTCGYIFVDDPEKLPYKTRKLKLHT